MELIVGCCGIAENGEAANSPLNVSSHREVGIDKNVKVKLE